MGTKFDDGLSDLWANGRLSTRVDQIFWLLQKACFGMKPIIGVKHTNIKLPIGYASARARMDVGREKMRSNTNVRQAMFSSGSKEG